MFSEMVQRSEQLFFSPVETSDSHLFHLPIFLEALASITGVMDQVCQSVCLSVCHLSVCLSVSLFVIFLSVSLFSCLSVYIPICQFISQFGVLCGFSKRGESVNIELVCG